MASQSAFLSLPRELRDIIYEYTFTRAVETKRKSTRSRNAGILFTNKQLQAETTQPYYERTTFQVADYDDCVDFLGGLPTSTRNLIKDIHISPRLFDPHNQARWPFLQGYGPIQSRRRLLRRQVQTMVVGFRMFKQDLETLDGISVGDEVLKVRSYTWDGRVNHHVWTPDPTRVAFPSLI